MIAIEKTDNINAVGVDDINNINRMLFDSIYISDIHIGESEVDYKEKMIDRFADMLTNILIQNPELSSPAKFNIINLLDKLNTQRDNLELIKSKILPEDLLIASKRFSKKSQSAFEQK